jgi:hypothetical protein
VVISGVSISIKSAGMALGGITRSKNDEKKESLIEHNKKLNI